MPQRRASSDIFGLRALSLFQALLQRLAVAGRRLLRDRRHAGAFREMPHQPDAHFVGGDIRSLDIAPELSPNNRIGWAVILTFS